MQIWFQALAFQRCMGKPKKQEAGTVEDDRRGLLFWRLPSIQGLLFLNDLRVTLQPQFYWGMVAVRETQVLSSLWIQSNLSVYAKPSGIQATTAWLIVLLKGKSSCQSCWTSKVRGLVKWCKYTWALMMLLPLPRKKGQYWQQPKGAQSWYGDGDEEGRESTRCKMSYCSSFTGINNSFD